MLSRWLPASSCGRWSGAATPLRPSILVPVFYFLAEPRVETPHPGGDPHASDIWMRRGRTRTMSPRVSGVSLCTCPLARIPFFIELSLCVREFGSLRQYRLAKNNVLPFCRGVAGDVSPSPRSRVHLERDEKKKSRGMKSPPRRDKKLEELESLELTR